MSRVDIEQRIARGRTAIALAKEKGLDTTSWEREVTKLEKKLKQAQEVAAQTRKLLETRGWCLWRCRALDDEVMVVLRDELVTSFPSGYPTYLEQELDDLLGVNDSTLRLIHEAKKLAGARIVDVERNR